MIHQKNALWKTDEAVSKLEIVLRETIRSSRRKTRQIRRPGEFYHNRETSGELAGLHCKSFF